MTFFWTTLCCHKVFALQSNRTWWGLTLPKTSKKWSKQKHEAWKQWFLQEWEPVDFVSCTNCQFISCSFDPFFEVLTIPSWGVLMVIAFAIGSAQPFCAPCAPRVWVKILSKSPPLFCHVSVCKNHFLCTSPPKLNLCIFHVALKHCLFMLQIVCESHLQFMVQGALHTVWRTSSLSLTVAWFPALQNLLSIPRMLIHGQPLFAVSKFLFCHTPQLMHIQEAWLFNFLPIGSMVMEPSLLQQCSWRWIFKASANENSWPHQFQVTFSG